jgi:hypothetical protein
MTKIELIGRSVQPRLFSSDGEIAVAKSSRLLINPRLDCMAATTPSVGYLTAVKFAALNSSQIKEKDGVCSDCKLIPLVATRSQCRQQGTEILQQQSSMRWASLVIFERSSTRSKPMASPPATIPIGWPFYLRPDPHINNITYFKYYYEART